MRVKNIIKKMHGLQVRQVFAPGQIFRSEYNDPDIVQELEYVTPDDPRSLDLYVPPFATDPAKEVYMKRATVKDQFINCGLSPVHFTVHTVIARDDIPSSYTLSGILNTGAPATYTYDCSVTTGHLFQQLFKIVKTTRRWLQPGRTMAVKVSRSYSPNKAFTGNYQANQTDWYLTKGQVIKIVVCRGILAYDNGQYNPVDNGNAIGLVPYMVQTYRKYYFSWYTMDDAEPDSNVLITPFFPTVMQANWNTGDDAFFPSYAVAQDNYVNNDVPARPQPVTQTAAPVLSRDNKQAKPSKQTAPTKDTSNVNTAGLKKLKI